ncbi:MAG: hypothetical protein SGARI_003274, partial [Bacillariaceae sp.]
MVQGLAFLSKKGFNPQNNDNRKRVWEAQQASKNELERARKRETELRRERENAELEESLKGEIGGQQAQLRFMYDAPPGMTKTNDEITDDDKKPAAKATNSGNDPSSLSRLAQASAGDDAAAAAFRQMLAATAQNQTDEGHGGGADGGQESANAAEQSFGFAPVLQGSSVDAMSQIEKGKRPAGGAKMDGHSALEKAVGRKDRSSQNLSYQQQIERFPQLKNAPMAQNMKKIATGGGDGDGDAAASAPMMVNFKPLGAQILHVRCLACGIWGHQRGDRECAKSGWNPFALPSQANKESGNVNTTSSSIMPVAQSQKEPSAIDKSKRRRHDADDSDSDSESRR